MLSEDFFDLDDKDLPDLDLLDLLADLDSGDDLDLGDLPDLLLVDLADLDEEICTTLGGCGEILVDPVSELLRRSEVCEEEGSSSVAVITGGSSGGSSFGSEVYYVVSENTICELKILDMIFSNKIILPSPNMKLFAAS